MCFLKIYELYGKSNHLLFTEENVLNYRPGGYHPVALGDSLKDGRYKIRHKLGFGDFSTVWAARDSKLDQWVSIKIITAERTNQSHELQNLRALAKLTEGGLASQYIVDLLDDFLHEGPNGCHQCLVFELLGPTANMEMEDLHDIGERLDPENLLRISAQLLQGLAFMHKAGFTHGDLTIMNVAFHSSRLAHLSNDELSELLGPPESDEIIRMDGEALGEGIPNEMIKSTEWPGWPNVDDEDDQDIRIIDLGEAFSQNAVPETLAQPEGLQAPETFFTGKFDHTLDLWRAGLMIYCFTFGIMPFNSFNFDCNVALMINLVGKLPSEWQPKWKQRELDAGEEFGPRTVRGQLSELTLEQTFDEHIHEPELRILLPVMKGLTRFLPSDRIGASQALDLIRDDCATGHYKEASDDDSNN